MLIELAPRAFLRRRKIVPVIFCKSTDFFIISFGRRREFRERKLGNIHPRMEHNRDGVLISQFKRDIEKMTWINNTCGVVNHETNPCERRFPTDLDKKMVGAKILL